MTVFFIMAVCVPLFAMGIQGGLTEERAADSARVIMAGGSFSSTSEGAVTASDSAIEDGIEGEDSIRYSQVCNVTREAEDPKLPDTSVSGIDMKLEHRTTGWKIVVTLPPESYIGMERIYPEYSYDGSEYFPILNKGDGEDVSEWEDHESHEEAIAGGVEPLDGFLSGKYDRLFIRLKLEGLCEGYSEEYLIERDFDGQAFPEGGVVIASHPSTIRMKYGFTPNTWRGLYQVTVREGESAERLKSRLPAALAIDVSVQVPDPEASYEGAMKPLAVGKMEYQVDWNVPQGILQTGKFENVVKLTPPTGETILEAEIANYVIPEVPAVKRLIPDPDNPGEFTWEEEPFDLAVNVIPANEKAAPQLGMGWWNETEEAVLSASLPFKPSGARSIVPEYSLDGGKSWSTVERIEGNDLTQLGYFADMVPKQKNYGAPLFFDKDKTPMKEYLENESNGFLVRLNIDDGVYDGISAVAPWPGNYKYDPPPHVDSGGDGGDGNRGDAGGNDSDGDGIRTELPDSVPESGVRIEDVFPIQQEKDAPVISVQGADWELESAVPPAPSGTVSRERTAPRLASPEYVNQGAEMPESTEMLKNESERVKASVEPETEAEADGQAAEPVRESDSSKNGAVVAAVAIAAAVAVGGAIAVISSKTTGSLKKLIGIFKI